MAEPYIGEIRMFGFNFAPVGWALCNGQLLAISSNQALFALIGTFYGGNGTTTFALPNLQGNVAIHQGNGFTQGEVGGSANVTLLTTQIPAHSHNVNCNGSATGRGGTTFDAGVGETPVNNYPGLATSPANAVYSASASAGSTMNPAMIAAAGGSQPHNNLQPYLVLNFCIALQGIFPSRN